MAWCMSASLVCFLLLQWISLTEASHFRYGTIMWAPADSYSNTMRFTFRLAFRRSSVYCEQSTIDQGSLIGGGSWTASCTDASNPQCASTTIASTAFHCTDYSTTEDWSMGENNFTYTFPSIDEEWSVSYSACCWIYLTRGGGSWLVTTALNLTRRADNGRINSSPVSRSAAFVRFLEGCPQSLRIPVEDPDGDVVRCRFSTYSESNFNSDSFPYGVLDEISCVLKYEGANGTAGTYAVALTLEDFPAGTTNFNSVRPFSAVGLQFLVIISGQSGSCNDIPVFTSFTPQDGECSEVQVGSVYTAVIEVQVADVSKHIVEVITSSPSGMQLTAVTFHGGSYYRNVTWYPSQHQIGQQLFCFKAVDSAGLETEMRCVTILVGLSNTPRVIIGSRIPRNPISKSGSGFVQLSIKFDRLIKKPRTSSYIRLVLLPSGHTVYKVDTLSQYVILGSNDTTLYVGMPTAVFSMNGSYAILIDRGAVVGQGCSYDGPPTPGITSVNDWSFSVDGVCPFGYYIGPPAYTSCVDMNECGAPTSSTPSAADHNHNCFNNAVGIANRSIIADNQMTASSYFNSFHYPYYGRLNGNRVHGWCARLLFGNEEWLQVDFGQSFQACGLGTQGNRGHGWEAWATAFKLLYSQDGSNWTTYQNGSGVEVEFHRTGYTINQHKLPVPVSARYFRFHPTQRNRGNCLRVEIYGTFVSTTVTNYFHGMAAPLDFKLHMPANCEQTCGNTPGSYRCSCVSGYQLDNDGKSCTDIDECSFNNGGCSHHCFNIPGSFYCGCPEGITMSSNNLTCDDPSVSVTCNPNNMTVALEKETYHFFEVSQLHLHYASCRATENSTHLIISTPLNGCGTLVNETEHVLIFWNEIQADTVVIDNVITRSHDIKLPFSCSYSRKTLLSLGFTPRSIYFGDEAGYGNFTFKMDFYKDSSFAAPYTEGDYPLDMPLNDFVYLEYSVDSSADLVIMADNCKATKDGSIYSWPQYTIIENGCPRDTTLDYSYDPNRSFQQFKIKTFRFFDDYDTVYFHCELLACYKYSPNSRCSRGCLSSKKRKKRDVTRDEIEHEESTTKVILTRGPLFIKEKQPSNREDSSHSKQTGLIGGVVAAGGFGLIAVIALTVLYIKYRMARRLMNRKEPGNQNTTQSEQLGQTNPCFHDWSDTIEI
ncbi:uncharacterized protein LOC144659409 isoform X1 [Oculina patagonica]